MKSLWLTLLVLFSVPIPADSSCAAILDNDGHALVLLDLKRARSRRRPRCGSLARSSPRDVVDSCGECPRCKRIAIRVSSQ